MFFLLRTLGFNLKPLLNYNYYVPCWSEVVNHGRVSRYSVYYRVFCVCDSLQALTKQKSPIEMRITIQFDRLTYLGRNWLIPYWLVQIVRCKFLANVSMHSRNISQETKKNVNFCCCFVSPFSFGLSNWFRLFRWIGCGWANWNVTLFLACCCCC